MTFIFNQIYIVSYIRGYLFRGEPIELVAIEDLWEVALDVRVGGAQQVQAAVQISKSLKLNVFFTFKLNLINHLTAQNFQNNLCKEKK